MAHPVLDLTVIGVLGIGAQWLAWRTQLPAIALLLGAGFLAGPLTGVLDPQASFGALLAPLISVAVAIILFEGGLTLNFAEIRETSPAVRRLVFLGAPATWGLGFLAAHYLAGLSAPTAAVLAGIMVVTGPTVIMPLLRFARLPQRPASLLRWEAIVADPIGALFAVLAYEIVAASVAGHGPAEVFLRLAGAVVIGVALAYGVSRLLVFAFTRGHVPEFLKAPILLVVVIATFEATNLILAEAGLLTVTLLGVALANTRLASLEELRRFKETITILLVSGLFIILTAATSLDDLLMLGWRDAAFVIALLFVIRPIVVFAATLGSKLTWPERLLCAWIAPRGVVAVAVSGLFATSLAGVGVEDASRMASIAFAVVIATVILHGFSIRPLAQLLKITRKEPQGLLIVGGSPWSTALAERAREIGLPVLIADSNWNHLAAARQRGVPIYYGEILSEAAEHRLDVSPYGVLVAATDNDAYNALVCSDLGPEMGRANVFQLGRSRVQSSSGADTAAETDHEDRHALHFTVGGRTLFRDGAGFHQLQRRLAEGWTFSRTRLTPEYSYDDYLASRDPETKVLFVLKPNGRLTLSTTSDRVKAGPEDLVLAFGPQA